MAIQALVRDRTIYEENQAAVQSIITDRESAEKQAQVEHFARGITHFSTAPSPQPLDGDTETTRTIADKVYRIKNLKGGKGQVLVPDEYKTTLLTRTDDTIQQPKLQASFWLAEETPEDAGVESMKAPPSKRTMCTAAEEVHEVFACGRLIKYIYIGECEKAVQGCV